MTSYEVQFEMPVDNPVKNVRVKRGKKKLLFYVPINLPDIESLTLAQLLEFARRAEVTETIHNP